MGEDVTHYTLIWLRSGDSTLLISKRRYVSADAVVAEYGRDYMASMEKTLDEILEYVRGDYELDEDEVQRIRERLQAFEQSGELVMEAPW
jgi:hypothetical protein